MDIFAPFCLSMLAVTGVILATKKEEAFTTLPSSDSMPKNKTNSYSGLPLFLNMYPRFGQDFKLFDYIQKLKLNHSYPSPNASHDGNSRNLLVTKKLPVIILVPGLGATSLYAKWNKPSGGNIKTVDISGDFQQGNAWSCNQTQDSWEAVWPPDKEGLASYCWADNIKVTSSGSGSGSGDGSGSGGGGSGSGSGGGGVIKNAEGVDVVTGEFGSLDFANDDYMYTLLETLKAAGHVEGVNLFGAGYDFRKIGNKSDINSWCMSLSKLVEQKCGKQDHPAIIIGHDLGAVIANYFLTTSDQSWKNKYIGKFISVSGTFGGCPKALRNVLSGISKSEANFSEAVKAYSGLSLMLPNPILYSNKELVRFNNITYTGKDIRKLVETVSVNAANTYDVGKYVMETSMKSPGVEVHVLAGSDIPTESSYTYRMSLSDEPLKKSPINKNNLPYNQTFKFPDDYEGDGTMPKFCLEYPLWWAKTQQEPVYFQFFANAEHTKILSMFEPVRYIVDVCALG